MYHQLKLFKGTCVLMACLAGAVVVSSAVADGESRVRLAPVFAVTSFSGGKTFLGPQAVSVDAERGDIYVADTNNGRIVVFNYNGQLVTSFNHHPRGRQSAEPVGVAVDKSGRVYVTDASSHLIYVYDLRGRLIDRMRPRAADADALFGRMAVDTSGNLYVTVRNKGCVYVYGSTGALRFALGGGNDKNRLEMPSDVAVDSQGRIYALSSLGTAVRVYDAKGNALFQFGKHAVGPENFAFPTAIDVDADGRIWITDSFADCIKVYTSMGAFVTNIGGLDLPVDVSVWPKEMRIFVLEKNARRLSSYTVERGGSGP
ncbi:MAG: NHL repeat-containing protein [Armatimonadota bacterium]|nr:NHL repeat-containing protein [Armatimonadota bacterium]